MLMPKKTKYRKKMKYLGYIYVDLGWRHQYCGIYSLRYQYVTYYFVDNEFYFNRDEIYDELGQPYHELNILNLKNRY